LKIKADIFIVDGRHLLWRCFSSYKDLSVEIDGEDVGTGGIYGFLSALTRLHRRYGGITIVAWEGESNFRKELYPLYKDRGEMSEDERVRLNDIRSQERRLRIILKAMGVRQYRGDRCEADDVIGRLSKVFEERKVIIYSGDSDLLQLVGETTFVAAPGYRGKSDHIYDTKEVIMRWGLNPTRISEIKALAGDSSDNIPGIKGIGVAFASKLLDVYGDLEDVIDAAKKNKEHWPIHEKYRTAIAKKAKKLRLFKNLTTIRRNYDMFYIEPKKSQKKLIKHLKKYKFISLIAAPELKILLRLGGK
jgi:DNA polymerase-1